MTWRKHALPLLFATCCGCTATHLTDGAIEEDEAVRVVGEFIDTEREAQEPYCECFDCDPAGTAEHVAACYEAAARLHPQEAVDYFDAWLAHRQELNACYRTASCADVSSHGCVVEPPAILREPPPPGLADAITDCGVESGGQVLDVMRAFFELRVVSHTYYCDCVECESGPPSEGSEAERFCRDTMALRHPDALTAYYGAWVSHLTEVVECYQSSSCEEVARGDCSLEPPAALSSPPPPAVWLLSECAGL